jgi:hypothetical protein
VIALMGELPIFLRSGIDECVCSFGLPTQLTKHQDEVRIIGMLKLHTDCMIGKPGPGRMAAVPQKTPLQLARNAPEVIVVRVSITPDDSEGASGSGAAASATVYTFFFSRNQTEFGKVEMLRVGAHGSEPVTVPYDVVANRHLTVTKREVPSGMLDVLDVSGAFVCSRDRVRTSGDTVTAVLTRLESGVNILLKITIQWSRTARTLTMKSSSVFYEKQPPLPGAPGAADTSAAGPRASRASVQSVIFPMDLDSPPTTDAAAPSSETSSTMRASRPVAVNPLFEEPEFMS